MENAEVVVVGAGCIGASIAYNLKKRGIENVMMVEKRFIGSGATDRSVGVVRQHYSTEFMAVSTLRIICDFQQDSAQIVAIAEPVLSLPSARRV